MEKSSVEAKQFSLHPISLPQQKTFEGRPFPLVLSPLNPKSERNDDNEALLWHSNGEHTEGTGRLGGVPQTVGQGTVDKLTREAGGVGGPSAEALGFARWLGEHRGEVEEKLAEYGAILFRGLPLSTAHDFNAAAEAFGREALPYVGGAAPRTNVVGRVFTSNESPPDQKIPFHHEMAQVPEFPAQLFFFCEKAPVEGGETPLLPSHLVTREMERRQPAFVRNLREKGLVYVRVLGEADDPSSAIGRGWRSTFLTSDKEEAERRGKKLGVTLEWVREGEGKEEGSVRTISPVLPAFRKDEKTGREAWFNSMVAAFTGWKDARNDPEKAVTFGDFSPLPRGAVLETLQVMEELAVAIPWQVGDLLLVDNHTVQHSRRSFVPPRRVLAALNK